MKLASILEKKQFLSSDVDSVSFPVLDANIECSSSNGLVGISVFFSLRDLPNCDE